MAQQNLGGLKATDRHAQAVAGPDADIQLTLCHAQARHQRALASITRDHRRHRAKRRSQSRIAEQNDAVIAGGFVVNRGQRRDRGIAFAGQSRGRAIAQSADPPAVHTKRAQHRRQIMRAGVKVFQQANGCGFGFAGSGRPICGADSRRGCKFWRRAKAEATARGD